MLPSLPVFTHLPSALIVIALLLIMVIAPIASALVAAKRPVPVGRAKHLGYARAMLVLWSLSALALYALRLRGESAADVGLVRPDQPLAAYGLALAIVAVLAVANMRGARGARFADYHERVRRVIPLTGADWAWFVPVVLSAGICEEFLYRGYALNVIAALTGSVWLGVALSTAAFGLAHAYQGWRGVVGTTILGLAFALIYVAFGSIYPCMLAHILQDFIGGAALSRRLARSATAPVEVPAPETS